VLENHQRRDAADSIFRRRALVLVDVQLRDLQPSRIFLRHLVEYRRDHLARAAPLGPVIDQHGRGRLQHFGLERVVGYVMDVLGHREKETRGRIEFYANEIRYAWEASYRVVSAKLSRL